MKKIYHILNGDALLEMFPEDLGTTIIARECMIDGPTNGKNVKEILNTRAKYLNASFGTDGGTYEEKVIPEFMQLDKIEKFDEINLWFEDDLFCQLNLWFVCYCLKEFKTSNQAIYLVRPKSNLRYGFGAYDTTQLLTLYMDKEKIDAEELSLLAECWRLFQSNKFQKIKELITKSRLDIIQPAVQALIDWKDRPFGKGEPEKLLKELVDKNGSENFGLIFQKFSSALPIYGFGDVQVKRMIDKLKAS